MFVLVLWARVCHICSRMHIHTRAYVTKKKPHVHACRHMCHSSCPTAPIDIRPRQLTNPEPHTWFLRALPSPHLARASSMARRWAWGHAAVQLASCSRARPLPAQAQVEHRPGRQRHHQHEHRPRPAGRQPRKQGSINHCKSAHGSGGGAAGQPRPGGMHSSGTRQKETQPRGNRVILVCLCNVSCLETR